MKTQTFTIKIWGCFVLAFLIYNTQLQAQKVLSNNQAVSLIQKNAATLGLTNNQLENLTISSTYYDRVLDANLVYIQQTFIGLPIFNNIMSIAFKNEIAASVSGAFISISGNKAPNNVIASIKPNEAIALSAKYLDLAVPQNSEALKTEFNGGKLTFDGLGISQENITIELMWVLAADNQLELSWQVKIVPIKSSDYWLINLNAATGIISSKINLTVNCNWGNDLNDQPRIGKQSTPQNKYLMPSTQTTSSVSNSGYRVIPYPMESPAYGSFSLVNNPWLLAGIGNLSGSLGWQNDGTTDYNITRGNNVWAKEDIAGDNETTIGVSAISSTAAPNYTFDFTLNTSNKPTTVTNQSAAITNLFYWNNIMHDLTYQYGFDEASGNFQSFNQGRGGFGNDYLLADAQDGSGTNNANFATPVDGSRPRMQMFLFSPASSSILKINSTPVAIPAITAFEGVISANNKLTNLGPATGNLVLYDNGFNNGCSSIAAGSLTGKIVLLLYNGGCNPAVSAKNAQNAGAVGVVMQLPSNIPAAAYSGGTDNSVTIPLVFIDFAPGNNLKTAMLSGTVNLTLSGIALDGDFDNGVIAHEYAHGISNRLTGGSANSSCLQNAEQMGEGWSDYYALMVTTNWATATTADGPNKRPLGNYVLGQDPTGAGIRTYPYSTNMTINPWTYSMLATGTTSNGTPGEVHLMGEIWAATLWDMTWNIIGIDGINTNLYNANGVGGNLVALKLVTQGLKLQPCSPGFIDGRNAILKADTLLYNGRYSCAIWNAFARRGMGKNASQGSSNSVTDQTANFTLPNFDIDTTATICNSFNWYGTVYTTSGNYTQLTTLPGGCNRTITLHLTVKSSSSSITNLSICSSALPFTWNGLTFTGAGSQTAHFTNTSNCDSAATLNLTIKPNYTITATSGSNGSISNIGISTICEGNNSVTYIITPNNNYNIGDVQVDGVSQGTITTYIFSDVKANHTIIVSFNLSCAASTSSTTQTACISYTWNGTIYTNSGDYVKHLTNYCGLDSAATLHLTINQPTTSTSDVNVCGNQLPYSWNGTNYNGAGTFNKILTNSKGCDSIATLVLTVGAPITPNVSISTANTTICSNANVTFTASSTTGGSSPIFKWNKNGISAGTGTSITFVGGTLSTADSINCTLTANNGCQTTATATSNKIVLTILASKTIGNNSTVSLFCTLGDSKPIYNTNTINGGYWSSSDTNVAKVITGADSSNGYITAIGNGSATITYIKTATSGCKSTASSIVTVLQTAKPNAIIANRFGICKADTTLATTTTPNGIWSSLNAYANVNSSGIVTAVNAGLAVIRYTTTNGNCSSYKDTTITVYGIPSVPSIAYAPGTINPQYGVGGSFCAGKAFTLVGTPSGGIWSSTGGMIVNPTSGLVTLGASVGAIAVTYTKTVSGCSSSKIISGTITVCSHRGVANSNEQLVSNDFTMHPNPTKAFINLSVKTLMGAGSILITDLYGKQVRTQTLSMGSNTVDVSYLSKGFYFVSVITNEGKSTKKLIVE